MKLSSNQKQWALTASLATVLSFNLVMSLGSADIGSENLASNKSTGVMSNSTYPDRHDREIAAQKDAAPAAAKEDGDEAEGADILQKVHGADVTTTKTTKKINFAMEDGMHKVMFIKDGDKTVAAISKKTEAGADCLKCGLHIALPKNFESSAEDLEVALRAAMKDAKSEKAIAKDEKSKDKEDQEEIDPTTAALDNLKEKCDTKSNRKDSLAQVKCFSDGLVKLMKDKNLKFSKEEVKTYFIVNIAKPLLDLTKTGDKDDRFKAQSAITSLITKIPKGFGYLEQILTRVSADVVLQRETLVSEKIIEYKKLDQLSKSQPGNLELKKASLEKFQQVIQLQNETLQFSNDLGTDVKGSLDLSAFYGNLDKADASSFYTNDYEKSVKAAFEGMSTSWNKYLTTGNTAASAYQVPMVDIANGATITLADGTTLSFTSTKNNVTSANSGGGIMIRPNTLTAQNGVVPGLTPMIADPNGVAPAGAPQVRIVQVGSAPIGQQQQLPTRSGNNMGAPMIVRGNN
jgi:hypothetical protein